MNLTRDLIFLVLYLIGVLSIVYWRKQKKDPSLFFYDGMWTFTVILTYFVMLGVFCSTFYFLIPLLFFSIFAFPYFTEERRLLNGLLFNVSLINFGIYLLVLLYETQSIFLGGLIALVTIPLLLILLFGIYGLIVLLFQNGVIVLCRESHLLANFLTLILAIFLTLFLVFGFFLLKYLPQWINVLFFRVPLILIYLFTVLYNSLTAPSLCQFNRPRYNQDFTVMLGAGLINGETVSPLLAKRINKTIAFCRAQSRATLNPPILLMFGGQGAGEKVSEAITMKQYAMGQGVPERDILIETNSTTTLENMLCSKEIMNQQMGEPYRAIFSSDNYHIFRAGLYAQQTRLKANNIDAKAAFYYLPNAFLGEYITILVISKKRHMIICGLLFAGFAFLSLIALLF